MRQTDDQRRYGQQIRPLQSASTAPPARVARGARAVALRRPRATWRDAWREVALALVVTCAYFLTRGLIRGRASDALAHARDILDIERTLHLDPEAALQHLALLHPLLLQVANIFYLAGHLPVLIAVAIWLYRAHRPAYRIFRNAFGLSALAGLAIYVVLPVAPPRFLPGFVDTLKATGLGLDGSAVGLLYNPYAAMPSLHVGWALLAGLALVIYGRAWWLRLAGAALPLLMTLTVLVTGNHFVLDIAAGTGIALLALTCSWWLAAARGRARNRPDTEGRCRMLSGRSRRLPPPSRARDRSINRTLHAVPLASRIARVPSPRRVGARHVPPVGLGDDDRLHVSAAPLSPLRSLRTSASSEFLRPPSPWSPRTHIHPFPPQPLRSFAPSASSASSASSAVPLFSPSPSALSSVASVPSVVNISRPRVRHRWPHLVLRTVIPPALLFAVLVLPPQSLRATLVTLLIVAALGILVWRLPMADE